MNARGWRLLHSGVSYFSHEVEENLIMRAACTFAQESGSLLFPRVSRLTDEYNKYGLF